ncbi:hypothetical protein, conserved [Babesia ovata]|uniref:Uncharacterized protein n=1 Tax=Babesia ovata TaxID=189622 RepID=A0A2H6K8E4_9APIC|nr:uncharacterized protein BOVATA_007540 [Babesia ovata]GBE59261.1 hypothetical protein, conserved [Babesia ovata]
MVYSSLAEAPRNLKEAIDWLMAVKGTDAEVNLKAVGAAVYNFLADKSFGKVEIPDLEKVRLISKKFMEKPDIKDHWFVQKLLEKLNEPTHKTQKTANALRCISKTMLKNLARGAYALEAFLNDIKHPDLYISAYSPEATWGKSCAKNPEDCIVVFVGMVPMLWSGIHYMLSTCKDANMRRPPSLEDKHMREVLRAVGYSYPQWRPDIRGSDFVKALGCASKNVKVAPYGLSGYWV